MRYLVLFLMLLFVGNQHASAQIEGQFVRPDTVVTIGFLIVWKCRRYVR